MSASKSARPSPGRLAARARAALHRRFAGIVLPNPRPGAAGLHTMIYLDDGGRPNARLLALARECIASAAAQDLSEISGRIAAGPRWPDIWPGEHYKLLAALVAVLQPRVVVEVGTSLGHSALALKHNLRAGARVVTFDLVRFGELPGHVLRDEDFADGRLVQVIDDISMPDGFARHRELLESAGLLFLDAAKDGRMEARLVRLLSEIRFAGAPIVVFDDIRIWNMLRVWHDLDRPRLDMTSFGHWSGTGIVDWCG